VQRHAEDRVDRARRQLLGLRDERCRGVVDQHVDRIRAPDLVHHRVDSGRIAHVALEGVDLRAVRNTQRLGGLVEHLRPAPAQHEPGAQFGESAGHGRPQTPGARRR
jgi:hypothetical protein